MNTSQPRRRIRSAPIRTVGLRIRKLRRERGLKPLALAGPEFSKPYLRAVERCKLVPSLQVLELFAQRLGVPLSQLLRARVTQYTGAGSPGEAELGPVQEDLNYQFSCTKTLIREGKLEEATEGIRRSEAYVASLGNLAKKLPADLMYRLPLLLGMVHVNSHNTAAAIQSLHNALRIIEGDEGHTARVRNVLGNAYYLQEQPHMAIKEHLECLRAVQTGALRDLSTTFSIYRNLANDYYVLGDAKQALAMYKLALPLLQDLNDPGRKAAIYLGMGMAYWDINDMVSAILCMGRARELFLEINDHVSMVDASVNLAELLILEQRYDEAEPLLEESSEVLLSPDNPTDELILTHLSRVYAMLTFAQGDLERAEEYAQASINFGKTAAAASAEKCAIVDTSSEGGDKKISPGNACYPINAYVEALYLAAKVAERREQFDRATNLLESAMEWAAKTGSQETVRKVALGYAQALEEHGADDRAMAYYKAAAEAKSSAHKRPASRSSFVG